MTDVSVSRYRTPYVCVTNDSTVVTDDEVRAICAALQKQVAYDFRKVWNAPAHIQFHSLGDVPAGAWVLEFLDTSDESGALGYHWLTDDCMPHMRVFAADDKKYGCQPSVTASHELLETLADPMADRCVQIGGEFWAYECCDAVEADQFGYAIDGVLVSNFQTPEWYIAESDGPWDFKGFCTAPLQLLDGGYQAFWTPKSGWTQRFAGHKRGAEASPRFAMRVQRAEW